MTHKWPRKLSNTELRANKIPSSDSDWETIGRFALTFDGFEHWGGSEACAEIANAHRHDTVTDLRTCLFYEQRRWRHFGCDPDAEASRYIRWLVDEIRRRVQLADE